MGTIRIEYVSITHANSASPGADNVISKVLASEDMTLTGSATYSANNPPPGTQAVRITSIGGVAYVNHKDVASAALSIRLADGKEVILAKPMSGKISAMTGV